MKNLLWHCTTKKLTPANTLTVTVGERFLLQCEGTNVFLHKDSLHLVNPPQNPYFLRLMKVIQLTSTNAELEVVSYKTGSHKNISFNLEDGETNLTVESFSLEVESKLIPGQPMPSPFPPFPPISMPFPPFYFWMIIGILFMAVGMIAAKWFQKNKHMKLLKTLEQYKNPLHPIMQLSRELRRLQTQYWIRYYDSEDLKHKQKMEEWYQKIERCFRLFIFRHLVLPALDSSFRALINKLKHKGKKRKQEQSVKEAIRVLEEMEKIHRFQKPLKPSDLDQISRMSLIAAQKLLTLDNANSHSSAHSKSQSSKKSRRTQ